MVDGARDRAQLLLIGSVVVAVAILGTIVLLNIIHVPPDVGAQTDSQSVTDVERVDGAIESDLRELTMMHTSVNGSASEPLPYVDPVGFNDTVDGYGLNYTQLARRSSSALVSVNYTYDDSSKGVVARQNESGLFPSSPPPTPIITGSDTIPVLQLNITTFPSGTETLRVQRSTGPPSEITISDSEIEFGDATGDRVVFDVQPSNDDYVEVTLIGGVGQVRSNRAVNSSVELLVSDATGVGFQPPGGGAEGTFTISGTDTDNCPAAAGSPDIVCYGQSETIDVNPTFHVVYQDANVAYETTFSAFGGDS